MGKLPAFQFYPGDWRKDPGIQALTFHDRGIWWEILCLMHESEQRGKLILNGSAMTDQALSRVLGLDNQILTTTLTTLSTYGVSSRCEETGALMSRRMVRDEALRQVRKNCGKLGGNPNLVNQKKTTQDKQKSTPSSSSSSSSSDIPTREPEKPDYTPFKDFQAFMVPLFNLTIVNIRGEKNLIEHFESFQKLGADEATIRAKVTAYKAKFPTMECTPNAVISNWARLGASAAPAHALPPSHGNKL